MEHPEKEPYLNNDLKWMMKFFDEQLRQRDLNLIAQAKEYERRLSELNHENARILQAQEKSVSLDRFEGSISQIYNRIDDIRKDLLALTDFKQKQEGKGQGGKDIMDIIKLIIIIAGFFIAYFVIKK